MTLIQAVVDVLWPFVYQAFVVSQGYSTPKQQAWAKRAKDHHRVFDELSCFVNCSLDELVRP